MLMWLHIFVLFSGVIHAVLSMGNLKNNLLKSLKRTELLLLPFQNLFSNVWQIHQNPKYLMSESQVTIELFMNHRKDNTVITNLINCNEY